MKKILLAIVVFFSFVFLSCKSTTGASPNEVLSQFFDAMANQDTVKIKALTTVESSSMLGMMAIGIEKTAAKKDKEKYDKNKMEFGTAIINGDNAKVPVKDKSTGEIVNFPMKKENGQWKVAFDKSSIMDMGMEKINESKTNLGDSLQKGLNAMKNMNMDSLMNEVSKAKDSTKK